MRSDGLDQSLLWLGLGACLFVGVKLVAASLRETVRLTEVHHEQPASPPQAPQDVTRAPEEALNPETLFTLAKSPNYNISYSAISILTSRVSSNPESLRLLAADLSPNATPEARRRGKLVSKVLRDFATISAAPSTPVIPRHHEESPEEQALRRRHRQAIVVNDGDRPVGREDIIEPVLDGDVQRP